MTHHIRNPVARSPLLRKGGAHLSSKSGQRRQDKNQIKQEVTDWMDWEESDFPDQVLLINQDSLSQAQQVVENKGKKYIALFLCH